MQLLESHCVDELQAPPLYLHVTSGKSPSGCSSWFYLEPSAVLLHTHFSNLLTPLISLMISEEQENSTTHPAS